MEHTADDVPIVPPEIDFQKPSFWQRPAVVRAMPWVTSLAVHATIIGIASLLIVVVPPMLAPKIQQQTIIPDTTLVSRPTGGGVPNPGLHDDPTRKATQNTDASVTDSTDWATRRSDTLSQTLSDSAAEARRNVTPIGAGAKVSANVADPTARGPAGGGSLAPFGPGGGGGGQGQGLFGLPGGNVKKVVYVCDASGSMSGIKRTLLDLELKQAIDRLGFSQSFNVLLFRDAADPREPFYAVNPKDLLWATDKNKRLAADAIDRYDLRGQSDPMPALKAAFDMRPELIFLLTDGALQDPEAVVKGLRELNPGKGVTINTILFIATNAAVADDMNLAESERVMKQIASDNGGTYRLVRPEDLQR